jgi:hypothetical protein
MQDGNAATDFEVYMDELQGNKPAEKPQEKPDPEDENTDETSKENIEIAEEKPEKPEPIDYATIFKDTPFKKREELDAVINEHKTQKEKLAELEIKLAEKKKLELNDEDDLYHFKIKALKEKTKITDRNLLSNILESDLDKMSDIEKLKFKAVIDDPDLKGKDSIIERGLSKKYPTDPEKVARQMYSKLFEDDDNLTYATLEPEKKKEVDLEVEANTLELHREAKKAHLAIQDMRDIKDLPALETDETKKLKWNTHVENKIKEWGPTWGEVVTSLDKIQLPVYDKDGKQFEITIPKDFKPAQMALQVINDNIVKQDIKLTPEAIEQQKKLVVSTLWAIPEARENFLIPELLKKFRAMDMEDLNKVTFNSSAKKDKKFKAETKETDFDKYARDNKIPNK